MSAEGSVSKTTHPRTSDHGVASALDEALAAQDWTRVTELLLHTPLSLVHTPRGLRQMRLALEQMPTALRDERPDLRFHLEFAGLVPTSDFRAESIEQLFSGTPRERAALVRGLTLAIITRRLNGQMDQALEIVDYTEAQVVVEASKIGSSAESAASAYFAQAAKTFLLAGKHEKALESYLSAWKWRHQDELGFIAHEAAGNIALIHALTGRLEQGKEWIVRSHSWPSSISPEYSPVVQFAVPLAEFVIATEQLDLLGAKEILPNLAQPTQGFEFYSLVSEARIKFLLVSGQTVQAQRHIEEASNGLQEDVLRRLNTEALLQGGHLDEATEQAERILDTATAHLLRARIAALRNEYRIALDELASGIAHATDRMQLDFLMLQATSQLALGHRTEAKVTFEALLTRLNGCVSVFASAPKGAVRALFDLVPTFPCASATHEQWVARGVRPLFGFHGSTSPATSSDLSSREMVVLQQLLRGSSRKEVAAHESVSLNTVKTQSRSAFRKLGVSTIQEARTKSAELGIF